MPTSARPTVTRTKVRNLTREIRRESAEIDKTVDAVHYVAQKRGQTAAEFLDSPEGEYARGNLQELLNVVDGNSAILRELLVMPGGEL